MITTLALVAAKFIAEGTASHFLGKGLDKLFSKDEFQSELQKVINETLSDFESKCPIENETGKFPFYHSQIILNELLKIRIFTENGDKIKIIDELQKNDNIITPTESQISDLLDIFYTKIQNNAKLKQLNIEANYKSEIFEISRSIQQFESSLNNTISKISTDLTLEWRRELDVYKENLEQFKPLTALGLLNKLDTAIMESDNFVSDKISSKLHYLKALCHEILMDTTNFQKEFLHSYEKDSTNPAYKEKAVYVYYLREDMQKSRDLAAEIIRTDIDNPVANFILSIDDNEVIFYNNVKQKPNYIRKNSTFKHLTLLYFQKKKIIPSIIELLINDLETDLTNSLDFNNFLEYAYEIGYAIYTYITSFSYFDYNKRMQSTPIAEYIYQASKKVTTAIKDTEIEKKYQGLFFWWHLSDYIVNDNVDSLLSAKQYLKNNDDNAVMLLSNCLQFVGKENIALDILTSLPTKKPELFICKAFCYTKLQDFGNHCVAMNEFIENIEKVTVFNFERILPSICLLFQKRQDNFDLNMVDILEKSFECDIHKQIIETIIKILDINEIASYNNLCTLASHIQISNETKAILSYILLISNQPNLSVNLYRQFIDKTKYDQNLFYYIQALYYTKKDNSELLSLLKDWRLNANHSDDFLLTIEYELRQKLNDWEKALEIMKIIYSKYPNKESVISNYLVCLHEMGEKDKIAEFKDNLPFDIFSTQHCIHDVVVVLFHNGFVKESFELLYLFAKNKENSDLRMLFFNLCLNNSVSSTIMRKYEAVNDDCFVVVKYEETDDIKRIQIKKGGINDMQKALIGHKIGEKVHFKVPACDIYKSVIIQDVMNKFFALYYDMYQEISNPIESNLPITQFQLPKNYTIETMNDYFIKNFAPGEERKKHFIEENLLKYKRGKMPFSMLSIIFQGDFIRTYYTLSSPQYGILLNPNISKMNYIDLSDKEFVLDFSTIFCFYELSKSLNIQFKHRFIISKSISDYIKYKMEEMKNNPDTKMALDITIKGITPIIYPDNFKEQQIKIFEDIKQWINNNCSIEIVEDRLDELRKDNTIKVEHENIVLEYAADYMHIIKQSNRMLITDDALLHLQYGQQNREISSHFYLTRFFDKDIVNRELLKRNYVGVFFEKDFLKTEFIKKISGQENVYSQSLNSLCYLFPQNKNAITEILSLFLKNIYTDMFYIQDLNRETINLFVRVLEYVKYDVGTLIALQKRISKDFNLLGMKREAVLINLIGAIRILFPDIQ
jgi:hypothetical protein